MDIKWRIQSQKFSTWFVRSSSFYALFCAEIHSKVSEFDFNVLCVDHCQMVYCGVADEEEEEEEIIKTA